MTSIRDLTAGSPMFTRALAAVILSRLLLDFRSSKSPSTSCSFYEGALSML